MRSIGADIVDLTNVSAPYFEGAYDGLHYLNTACSGRVSTMMFHVVMNTMFPHCGLEEA